MKKEGKGKIIGLVVLLLIVVIGGCFLLNGQKKQEEITDKSSTETGDNTTTIALRTNKESEKWFAVQELGNFSGDGGEQIWMVDDQPELIASVQGDLSILSLKDGKIKETYSWEISENDTILSYFLDKDGEIWCVGVKDAEQKYTFYQYDKQTQKLVEEGTISSEIEELSYTYGAVKKAYVDESRYYLLVNREQNGTALLLVYDRDGNFLYSREGVSDFTQGEENELLLGCMEANAISLIKLELAGTDITEVWKKELESDINQIIYRKDTEEVFCALNDNCIYKMTEETEPKKIFDVVAYAPEIPSDYEAATFWVENESEIYMEFLDYREEYAKKRIYRFTEEEQGERTNCITVTLPFPMEYVQVAAKAYEKKYPERKVEIQTAYDSEEEFREYSSVYQEQMAARLMTGDYGDVILSSYGVYSQDVLATDTYMDLSDWIQGVEEYNNLNQNVLEISKVNEKLRGIPVGMAESYYLADTAMMESADQNKDGALTWSELLEEAEVWEKEGIEDKYLFSLRGRFTLDCIVTSNIYDLVDVSEKKIDIRQDWFLDLIEQYEQVKKAGYGYTPQDDVDTSETTMTEYAMVDENTMLVYYVEDESARLYETVWRFSELEKKSQKDISILPGVAGEKHTNYFIFPKYFFSVNNQTEKKEEALDFMEILVSTEVQEKLPTGLLALNEEAEENRMETVQMRYGSGDDYKEEKQQIKEYHDQLTGLLDQADWTYTYLCAGDLCDALDAYDAGEMTLEEALDQAEEKMWIRLNE